MISVQMVCSNPKFETGHNLYKLAEFYRKPKMEYVIWKKTMGYILHIRVA